MRDTLEFAIVCIGHHLILRVRRFRKELLLGLVRGHLRLLLAVIRVLVTHVGVNIRVGKPWLTELLVRLHHIVLGHDARSVAVVGGRLSLNLVEAIILQPSLRVPILKRGSSANITSGSESTFIRCKIHLLFLRPTLQQCPCRSGTSSKILVSAVPSNVSGGLFLSIGSLCDHSCDGPL